MRLPCIERWGRPADNTTAHEFDVEQGARARAVWHHPEILSDKPPVLYCSGFGTFGSEHGVVIEACNSDGRAVLTVDHLRESGVVFHPERLKAGAYARAMQWADETLGSGPFDMICYSEGGVNGPMAARMVMDTQKARVGNILLVAPAGILEHESFLRIASCIPKVGFQTVRFALNHRQEVLPIAVSMADYLLRNPGRAIMEVRAISRARSLPYLRQLKADGVKLALLTNHADGFFPSDLLQTEEVYELFDSVNELVEQHADHNALVFDSKSMLASLQILDSL